MFSAGLYQKIFGDMQIEDFSIFHQLFPHFSQFYALHMVLSPKSKSKCWSDDLNDVGSANLTYLKIIKQYRSSVFWTPIFFVYRIAIAILFLWFLLI